MNSPNLRWSTGWAGLLGWLAGWLAGWTGRAGWLTCSHDVMTIALFLHLLSAFQIFLILATLLLL